MQRSGQRTILASESERSEFDNSVKRRRESLDYLLNPCTDTRHEAFMNTSGNIKRQENEESYCDELCNNIRVGLGRETKGCDDYKRVDQISETNTYESEETGANNGEVKVNDMLLEEDTNSRLETDILVDGEQVNGGNDREISDLSNRRENEITGTSDQSMNDGQLIMVIILFYEDLDYLMILVFQ